MIVTSPIKEVGDGFAALAAIPGQTNQNGSQETLKPRIIYMEDNKTYHQNLEPRLGKRCRWGPRYVGQVQLPLPVTQLSLSRQLNRIKLN